MPSAVVTILCTRGVVTNDKPAKSGLLVSLVGRGSVIAKRCLAKVDTIPVVGFNIQLVDSYQHVGGIIFANSCLAPEIHNRSCALASICCPFKSTVVAKTTLSTVQLVNFIDSIAVSSLLFNSHTWCSWSDAALAKVESRLAYTYGCTLMHKVFDLNGTVRRIPDFAVFAAVNRGNAKFQIRVRRLRFFGSSA